MMEGRPAWRERPDDGTAGSGEDVPALAVFVWALALLVLVVSLSLWQVTRPARAYELVRGAVAATLDLPRYVAERGDELRALAEQGEQFLPPAFPVEVWLTPEEVSGAADGELGELLLARATDGVYVRGAEAFDTEGAADFGRLSQPGLFDLFVDSLTGPLGARAGLVAVVAAVVAAVAAAVAVVRAGWERALPALGWGAVSGVLPVVVLAALLQLWLTRGLGGDPYTDRLGQVFAEPFELLRNDGLAVLGAGLVLLIGARMLRLLLGGGVAAEDGERAEPEPTTSLPE